MNRSCNLPSFNVAFSGLYSSKTGVINQSCQLDVSKQRQAFQDMSGQTLDSPFPVYMSQSDILQNEAGIFRSLDEYDIVSLTDFDPENVFGTGIHEIPKSVLDEYVPWNSDDELINDEISLPDFSFTQQVCLSVSEPDPIPARHWNSNDQLTLLPAGLFNRHALPPVTLVNPINLNQTTSDQQTPPVEDIADSLPVESQRQRRQDPEKRELINQHQRERYKEKMTDPEKRKRINQRQRERRQDPEIRKLRNQRQRERRQNPEIRKLVNQRQRERIQDPEKRKLKNQRAMERYREIMADPEKRKLINQRAMERYRERMTNPEKRKLIHQRQRERRQEKGKLRNQRQRELRQDPEKNPDMIACHS